MSYKKTAEDVAEFLPHGALMVRDNTPAIELAYLEVQNSGRGEPVLVGWSYPNKDFRVELSNVLHQKNGWLCFSNGTRIVLRPLSEERGRIVAEMID